MNTTTTSTYPRPSFRSTFFTAVALSFCLSTIMSLWDGMQNPLDQDQAAETATQ